MVEGVGDKTLAPHRKTTTRKTWATGSLLSRVGGTMDAGQDQAGAENNEAAMTMHLEVLDVQTVPAAKLRARVAGQTLRTDLGPDR